MRETIAVVAGVALFIAVISYGFTAVAAVDSATATACSAASQSTQVSAACGNQSCSLKEGECKDKDKEEKSCPKKKCCGK